MVLTAILGLALDRIVIAGLKKTQVGSFQTWSDIFASKINADVLIIGSSRASRHISTAIIDSTLQVNSYNLGGDSYYFYMQHLRYDVYRSYNTKPRLIVQCADLMTFAKSPTTFFTQYTPYISDSTLNSRLASAGFDVQRLQTPIYRFYSQISTIKLGMFNAFNFNYNPPAEQSYKGYLPIDKQWDGNAFLELLKKDSINTLGFDRQEVFQEFDDYLRQCSLDSIKIVLVFTPLYRSAFDHSRGKDQIMKNIYDMSEKYKIPFLDYSGDTLCYNEKYFYNAIHLNTLGAEIFSHKLANDINELKLLDE